MKACQYAGLWKRYPRQRRKPIKDAINCQRRLRNAAFGSGKRSLSVVTTTKSASRSMQTSRQSQLRAACRPVDFRVSRVSVLGASQKEILRPRSSAEGNIRLLTIHGDISNKLNDGWESIALEYCIKWPLQLLFTKETLSKVVGSRFKC
ncbi:hypothetical protein GOP47_0008283 [Adiantum capillus-veneris]|uniref:Uncharacterized protein n=1 Tax=Adiantum capillus-veneris TaxID=13818 RepID=A0A9D4UZ15_ADICA|nr:hypothetical protein GOP47_0008283 [Adiantum capillus-veneris]